MEIVLVLNPETVEVEIIAQKCN